MMKPLLLLTARLLSLSLRAQNRPDSATAAANRKEQAETDRQNRVIDSFNVAARTFNQATSLFNAFNDYRNDQFKPMKSDAEIRQMMDTAQRMLWNAKGMVAGIVLTPADSKIQQPLQQLSAAISQAEPHYREAQAWLLDYFSKGTLARKRMFYKFSWL